MTDAWRLNGAVKDQQTITARWTPSDMRLIDGLAIREVLNVPKSNGYLTEIFRRDWAESRGEVDQVFQVVLDPGAISAWHAHATTTDRLFVSYGRARIVLYDAREDSPTTGASPRTRRKSRSRGDGFLPPLRGGLGARHRFPVAAHSRSPPATLYGASGADPHHKYRSS